MVIGFELTSVAVVETDGIVTLVVSVLDGIPSSLITVTLTTVENGSASSKLPFFCMDFQSELFRTNSL